MAYALSRSQSGTLRSFAWTRRGRSGALGRNGLGSPTVFKPRRPRQADGSFGVKFTPTLEDRASGWKKGSGATRSPKPWDGDPPAILGARLSLPFVAALSAPGAGTP